MQRWMGKKQRAKVLGTGMIGDLLEVEQKGGECLLTRKGFAEVRKHHVIPLSNLCLTFPLLLLHMESYLRTMDGIHTLLGS